MINFIVMYNENTVQLKIEDYKTIFELKSAIISALCLENEETILILSNQGRIDHDDSLQLPVKNLQLANEQAHSLFILNLNSPSDLWKGLCTAKIIGEVSFVQVGYSVSLVTGGKFFICKPCYQYCQRLDKTISHELVLENNFQCMCGHQNDSSCTFASSPSFADNRHLVFVFQNLNSILFQHAEELYKRERRRIEKENLSILERTFDFEGSISWGLSVVQRYEDEEVQDKALSVIPLAEIEKEAQENSLKSGLSQKDEIVISLLHWYRDIFFTWCNKPICDQCGENKTVEIENEEGPTEEERNYGASKTEVYQCDDCLSIIRFPRYNDPYKLCETRKGRCGEWAILFGCILRCLNYEVRIIDNFEDHVWNEYWSDSLNRWVHVDPCDSHWDRPLLYEQGWGRNMTYVLASSITGMVDVTRRYVKDWELIVSRRKESECARFGMLLEENNNFLMENLQPDDIEYLNNRNINEKNEMMKIKYTKDEELLGRVSGSKEWRKARGEI